MLIKAWLLVKIFVLYACAGRWLGGMQGVQKEESIQGQW
jgi:hypothetical protein